MTTWQEFLSSPFLSDEHCYSARVETFVSPREAEQGAVIEGVRWLHAGLREEGAMPDAAFVQELLALAREDPSWRRSSETVHVCALEEATAQLHVLNGDQLRVEVAVGGDCFFYDSASHRVSSYGFQCPALYDKSFLLPVPATGRSSGSKRNPSGYSAVREDAGQVLELRREGASGVRRLWFVDDGPRPGLVAAATVTGDGRSAVLTYEVPVRGTLEEFSLTRTTLSENEGWGSIQSVFVMGIQEPTAASRAVFPRPAESELYPGIHALVVRRAEPFLTDESHLEIAQRFTGPEEGGSASLFGPSTLLLLAGLAFLAAASISSRIRPRILP